MSTRYPTPAADHIDAAPVVSRQTRPALRAADVGLWLPTFTLWSRELVRFYRQRSRVVGVIVSPVIFWIVIGSGYGRSFQGGGTSSYLEYFFPGSIILILLFTAVFTMMSVIEDRKEGFLLSVLVAPCPRVSIALGKILGGATLAAAQGLIFAVFAPLLGIHLSLLSLLALCGVLFAVAFALTGVGFLIAWPMDSTHAFHAVVNLFLIPAWLVSGALFPLSGASGWMQLLMRLNPLTYGTEALRSALYLAARNQAAAIPFAVSGSVLVGFDLLMLVLALAMVGRQSKTAAG